MMSANHERWRTFARDAAQSLREQLDRMASLTAYEREQIAQRLEHAIANALEVPPDLQLKIEETAAGLIALSPDEDLVGLAWQRTRDRARRTAAIGALTTIPAVLPGLGSALAALGLVADWRFAAQQQRNLVLEIAALFGQWPENATEEIRALFLAATATAFAAPGTGRLVSRALAKQVARRGVARLLPGAGAAVAGALNYIATAALGRAAIEHFGTRAGFEIHGLFPSETHPAMPGLRNAIVEAMDSEQETPLFSDEARRAFTELAPAERDELIDLAAALALARGRDASADAMLAEIGGHLGFSTEEVDHIIRRAVRHALPMRQRLNAAINGILARSADSAESIWRLVGRLAGRNGKAPGRTRAHYKRRARSAES